MKLSNLNLTLFFTRPFSLQSWDKGGMLDREVALYKRIQSSINNITFVTYGGKEDLTFADRINDIRIVCNRWNWNERNYIRYLVNIFPLFSRKPAIFKSNQVLGSEVALASARNGRVIFIARCGNLRSLNAAREAGPDSDIAIEAREIEKKVFPASNLIVVPNILMSQYIQEQYKVSEDKITVIPNYVDTELFKPNTEKTYAINGVPHICFVGRLEQVKNITAVLEALAGLNVKITIVGDGSLRQILETLSHRLNLNVNFMGVIPNNMLPSILQSADIYIQPSFYEGHPKTIIEAMACGKPIIAGNVSGISELITHKITGYLCGTTKQEIRQAVQEVLFDVELRKKIGLGARKYAESSFSLDRVTEMELNIYEKILWQTKLN